MNNKKSKNRKSKVNALYIHIPFCHELCHYCDFCKVYYDESIANRYLDSLFIELDSYNITKVNSIYLGGGTPSSLNVDQLERLLKKVAPFLYKKGEFTIELNVESTTKEKLLLLKEYGINRLSIGVQSTNDQILQSLNRKHTFKDVKDIYHLARNLGFNNINLDLIYGVPHQDESILLNDLYGITSLKPDHLSIYELTIHPHTLFYLQKVKQISQDESRISYDLILKTLQKANYYRYEISNFSKKDKMSKHNLVYWQNQQYYGVGLGAHGYLNNIRYQNTQSITKYLNHNFRYEEEVITKDNEEKYFWLTNLRLTKGFKKKDYVKLFGRKRFFHRKKQIQETKLAKYVIKSRRHVRLNDEGLMLLDYLLLEIL